MHTYKILGEEILNRIPDATVYDFPTMHAGLVPSYLTCRRGQVITFPNHGKVNKKG